MSYPRAAEAQMDRVNHACLFIVDKRTEQPWDNGDYSPHFSSERDASDTIGGLDDPWRYRVDRMPYRCLLGPTCMNCEGTFEDWMDGAHHCTPGKAREEVECNDWRWTSRGWLCGNCCHLWEEDAAQLPGA